MTDCTYSVALSLAFCERFHLTLDHSHYVYLPVRADEMRRFVVRLRRPGDGAAATLTTSLSPAFARCFWIDAGVLVTMQTVPVAEEADDSGGISSTSVWGRGGSGKRQAAGDDSGDESDGEGDGSCDDKDGGMGGVTGPLRWEWYLKPLRRCSLGDAKVLLPTAAWGGGAELGGSTAGGGGTGGGTGGGSDGNIDGSGGGVGATGEVVGVAVVASSEKPFCCPECFKRIASETDARNHFRDKHGRVSLFAPPLGSGAGANGGGVPEARTHGRPPQANSRRSLKLSLKQGAFRKAGGGGRAPAEHRFGPLVVAFEDDHFAVVVKPQGIATLGEKESLARDGVLSTQLRRSPLFDALTKGRPVHRLDAATGGLVLVGKSHTAVTTLCAALAERRVRKRCACGFH